MLHQRYADEALAVSLLPRDVWRPFPTRAERAAWEGLPEHVRAQVLTVGAEALAGEWPALPATLCLEFARNGNRSRFQDAHFARRNRLASLVLAECVAGDGRFLDEIVNGVWLLCEESFWGLPAHLHMQQAGAGLPDTAEPVVDLFAAETAALLAWTSYLLGSALDTVSPLIRPRVTREIDSRILTPCLQRDDFGWLGLRGERVNNWNPWINSNWLACALLEETDPARRLAGVAKILRSVDAFIDGYPVDGGCDEGPSYWGRAGASLFDCLELLHSATGGAIDVFHEPLIAEIGRFIYRAHVAGDWYLNFADAPARLTPDGALVFRYGRRIGDPAMMAFGAWLARTPEERPVIASPWRMVSGLFTHAAMGDTPAAPPLPRDVWLPVTQVMVARAQGGSDAGLTLAVKGGHNQESHNHNDVGHFVVFADGKPVLVDAGVETYTQKTFSAERYDIWTMQSQYHNLPTVNGILQRVGRQFAARDLRYAADDAAARLELDIAPAYPPEAGITRWQRVFTLRRAGEITLTDRYTLQSPPRELFFTLLTPCAVTIDPAGTITLGEREITPGVPSGTALIHFPANTLRAETEEIPLADPQLQAAWGTHLTRILLHALSPAAEGEVSLVIEAPE